MPNPETIDAARWLRKFCKVYSRHERSIYDWAVTPHVSGLLLELTVERGIIPMLIQPLGRGQSYAQTASLALSIHTQEGQRLPGNAETVLQGLINVLRQADKGNLHIPVGGIGPGSAALAAPLDPKLLAQARARHADAIHWGQYLALRSLVTEDLYPHVSPLGELVTQEEIEAGWEATVARMKDGKAP